MSTALATRRPRGIDPGLGEVPVVPCQLDPPAWDVDRHSSGYSVRALAATAACKTCPLLAACDRAVRVDPPFHTCVAAGVIWVYGEPVDPLMWLRTTYATDEDGRLCARGACGKRYEPRNDQQAYCTPECSKRTRYERSLKRSSTARKGF